jgi:hypothetical protein
VAISRHCKSLALCHSNRQQSFQQSAAQAAQWQIAEMFTHGQVMPEPKHSQSFACPVYVLDNALQQSRPHRKWDERSRVGLYLGRSPLHTRFVALVLNITTARVSPPYQVQFDPYFQTIRELFGGIEPPSYWQSICGFTKSRKTPKSDESQELEAAHTDPHVWKELRNANASTLLNPVPSENAFAHQDVHNPQVSQDPHIFHQKQDIQNITNTAQEDHQEEFQCKMETEITPIRQEEFGQKMMEEMSKEIPSKDNRVNRQTYFRILAEVTDHFADQLKLAKEFTELDPARFSPL